jgi:hypothetical protein
MLHFIFKTYLSECDSVLLVTDLIFSEVLQKIITDSHNKLYETIYCKVQTEHN